MLGHAIVVFLTSLAIVYKVFEMLDVDRSKLKGFGIFWLLVLFGIILVFTFIVVWLTWIAFWFTGDLSW